MASLGWEARQVLRLSKKAGLEETKQKAAVSIVLDRDILVNVKEADLLA